MATPALKRQERLTMPAWMEPKLGFLNSDAENRETFFARVAMIFPPTDTRYKLIERAYETAKEAFTHIMRDGGGRYFEHLRATALIAMVHLRVRDANVIAALLLHDIIEDIQSWPFERVVRDFGEHVGTLVWWVTKPTVSAAYPTKEEVERKYHRNLREAPRMAVLIKVCDRLHNLMTIWMQDVARIERKIAETRNFILSLAEEHQLLIHELEDVLRMLETRSEQ